MGSVRAMAERRTNVVALTTAGRWPSQGGSPVNRTCRVFWITDARRSQGQTVDITCGDDAVALRQASQIRNGRAAEIWDRHRLLAIISADGTVSRVPYQLPRTQERWVGVAGLALIFVFLAMPIVVRAIMGAI